MNPLLRSAIRELKDQNGVILDALEDLDHILNLASLADRVLRIQNDLRTEALLRPVRKVGNATLRRLSIGALDFLRTEVADWFSPESEWTALSFAFCHAHGASPAEIWEHRGDVSGWKKTLKEWERTLSCSNADLIHAVQAFQEEQDELDEILASIGTREPKKHKGPGEAAPGSGDFGPLVELLCANYVSQVPDGMTPAEFWIWRVPIEQVELLTTSFLDRKDAESRAKRPGKTAIARDPDRAFMRAHHALREYMKAIIAEKRGANNAGE